MTQPQAHPKDPLHGVTLEFMLNSLVAYRGWEYMAKKVRVRCFVVDPSISSSLNFLRKTPWAREKVERMYLAGLPRKPRPRA